MTDLVKDGPESEGACQLVNGATKFWPNQRNSLIYQVWANCPQKIITVNKVSHGTTDHNIVELVVKVKGKIGSPQVIRKRSMKNWDSNLFKARVADIDWQSLYSSVDVNLSYGIFEEKLRSILDQMAPRINVQLKNNHKPWVSDELRAAMSVRDNIRDQAIKSRLPADWLLYKTECNKCNIKLRSVKVTFLKNQYKKLEIE